MLDSRTRNDFRLQLHPYRIAGIHARAGVFVYIVPFQWAGAECHCGAWQSRSVAPVSGACTCSGLVQQMSVRQPGPGIMTYGTYQSYHFCVDWCRPDVRRYVHFGLFMGRHIYWDKYQACHTIQTVFSCHSTTCRVWHDCNPIQILVWQVWNEAFGSTGSRGEPLQPAVARDWGPKPCHHRAWGAGRICLRQEMSSWRDAGQGHNSPASSRPRLRSRSPLWDRPWRRTALCKYGSRDRLS